MCVKLPLQVKYFTTFIIYQFITLTSLHVSMFEWANVRVSMYVYLSDNQCDAVLFINQHKSNWNIIIVKDKGRDKSFILSSESAGDL